MTSMEDAYRRDQQNIQDARELRASITGYRAVEPDGGKYLDPELAAVEQALERREEQLQATWN